MVNDNRGILYKVCQLYERNQENKKDLFQEIILQLWKSYPSYHSESKISTWVYRVALNTAISNFRKSSKKPAMLEVSQNELEIPDVFEHPFQKPDFEILTIAIEKLAPINKALILLYLEDKSYEEIAGIMGFTVSNVGVRLKRAREKLSQIIKQTEQ